MSIKRGKGSQKNYKVITKLITIIRLGYDCPGFIPNSRASVNWKPGDLKSNVFYTNECLEREVQVALVSSYMNCALCQQKGSVHLVFLRR